MIITVIILIILAAISISALTKGNFIGLATKAAQNYADAQEYEGGMMESYKNLLTAVIGNLAEGGTTPPEEEGEKVTASDLGPANYGEYVDYGIDINNNGEVDDWRIFYVGGPDDLDANGRIFLIAADYVPSNCSAIDSAISSSGMTHYTSEDNYETYYWNIAPAYGCNDGTDASSNNSKGQCSFPRLFMSTGYYCSSHVGTDGQSGNENARCASTLLCSDHWSSFKQPDYADYAIGGPTLEMWVKSWNQKHGINSNDDSKQEMYIKGEEGTTGAYGYCCGTEDNPNEYVYADLSSSTGYDDTLYFSHKNYNNLDLDGTGDNNEICHGYWLASPSAYSTDHVCSVDYGGYVFFNYYDYTAIRCASASLSQV